jgi:hypothetical protein
MAKEYLDIETNLPLIPGNFYVPASSNSLLETRIYLADKSGNPKDRDDNIPEITSFSRINDPKKYLSELLKCSADCTNSSIFIREVLLKSDEFKDFDSKLGDLIETQDEDRGIS